jgi:hypothetical protein
MSQERIAIRRTAAARAGLLAGPALLAAGSLVRPHEQGEGPASLIATVSSAPSAWLVGWTLTLLGSMTLLPGLAVLVGSVRRRGAALTTWGGTVLGAGFAGQVALAGSELVLVPLVGDGTQHGAVAAAVERIDSSPALAIAFLLYLPGMLFGVPLLFGGLWRAGRTPGWAVVAAVAAVTVDFFLSDLVPSSGAVSALLLAAAFAGVLLPRPAAMPRSLEAEPAPAPGPGA